MIDRRKLLVGAGSGLMLSGCDALHGSPTFREGLRGAEDLTMAAQRALLSRDDLARVYPESEISPIFPPNGTRFPDTPEYLRHLATGFRDWRLRIEGLVDRPLVLSLEQIRALPTRHQITRHDCVEGWSAIGKWHGPQLGTLLRAARLRPEARYIVFLCFDRLGGRRYYESIDLVDAFHPQTILAWAMNGRSLPVPYGAPLRLRVERQLGYKHAKYLERILAVPSLAGIYGGKGGYWEDVGDYEWYAGI